MSPAWIRKRNLPATVKRPKGGRSYQVLYRRGGRGWPIESAGSFKSEQEAKLRRDTVAGWLARGLNPKTELGALTIAPPVVQKLGPARAQYLESRVDTALSSSGVIRAALKWLAPLDHFEPAAITVADLQARVTAMQKLKPSTIATYVTYWQAFFEYAGTDPNPAASKHLKLPQVVKEQIAPPTATQFIAVLAVVTKKMVLPLITLEQTAMRVGELGALTWGDVDEQGLQFRLRSSETKTRRSRWVQVPGWLMDVISATCPIDDRAPERLVFPGVSSDTTRRALRRACTTAGVPVFTAHDLRHRRATIWHHDGVPTRVLMERGGWSRSDIPLEVYSHLLPPGEVPVEELEAMLS